MYYYHVKCKYINAIKLRLFPMSLLTKLTNGRRACPMAQSPLGMNARRPFLLNFSPPVAQPSLGEISKSCTAKLRSEIELHTENNETFAEAWERFKGYTSQCPHHGFNNESLLSTLYRGCLARYREMLDTASNGNFLNQDVDDGCSLWKHCKLQWKLWRRV
ncbi:unnamed protein product [Microthlaspi erraticum]|uniref:Retrotransposon gag domain-containing protein n=1 Tax=Microthlaspi erraticum TaxID=1685480 RepID=A0A6D2JZV2_9BRAS|nr:unnamed protein product [Microthlaspi erraticum]